MYLFNFGVLASEAKLIWWRKKGNGTLNFLLKADIFTHDREIIF